MTHLARLLLDLKPTTQRVLPKLFTVINTSHYKHMVRVWVAGKTV